MWKENDSEPNQGLEGRLNFILSKQEDTGGS